MYSRVTSLLFALFAFLLLVHAAPVPVDESGQVLEKRITHVGRVCRCIHATACILTVRQGTWFNVGLGHCGKWNKDTDRIVAISGSLYAQNGGSNCDQASSLSDELPAHSDRFHSVRRDHRHYYRKEIIWKDARQLPELWLS